MPEHTHPHTHTTDGKKTFPAGDRSHVFIQEVKLPEAESKAGQRSKLAAADGQTGSVNARIINQVCYC